MSMYLRMQLKNIYRLTSLCCAVSHVTPFTALFYLSAVPKVAPKSYTSIAILLLLV